MCIYKLWKRKADEEEDWYPNRYIVACTVDSLTVNFPHSHRLRDNNNKISSTYPFAGYCVWCALNDG